MTQSKWRLRFFLPFNELTTINFVGNFENSGKRYLDDIVIFRGMYGTPDYLYWYIHKDLTNYDFAGYSIELKLYLNGDPKSCYFQDKYRIIDVTEDFDSDRKLVCAIQEDYARLDVPLIKANIATLDFDETRTVKEVLRNVLEDNGILPVIFCEHRDPELMSIKFEYTKLTLDPKWTIGDFIKYIADENQLEWTIKYGILFIGPELYTYKQDPLDPTKGYLDATRVNLDRTIDNVSRNYFDTKIAFESSPLDVLYYYQYNHGKRLLDMRCVWAKHWVGLNGGTTKGCFVQVGTKFQKGKYMDSLEGQKEREDSYHKLFKIVKFNPAIEICRVITDAGNKEYIDDVSVEKDSEQYAKKTPRNVVMNVDTPIYTVPKVGKTTQYLDYKSGLFFPRTNDLTKNPNRLIFMPHDRIEQSVVGPFVLGNGSDDFKDNIPYKLPDDFRLQFPNGWCLYVKSSGETILQTSDADPSSVPSGSGTYIKMTPSGDIIISTGGSTATLSSTGLDIT